MICLTFLITLILLIWFKTDAFIVYSKLLKLSKLTKVDEWYEFKKTKDCSITHHQYLLINYPTNFWIKLITCPICLCMWLCIPICFINIYYYPIVCIISLTMYYGIIKLID